MSLENQALTPSEQEFSSENFEINVDNVLDGHGLEEISRVGFEKYREVLERSSYSDIIESQIDQVEKIKNKKEPKTSAVPEWLIHNLNMLFCGQNYVEILI